MTISKIIAEITICTFKPSQYHKNINKIKEFCYRLYFTVVVVFWYALYCGDGLVPLLDLNDCGP